MIYAGIDLAAKEKNPTGLAFINSNDIITFTLFYDADIIEKVKYFNPDIVAIDAPMSTEDRQVDIYLRKYGALTLKIPSMQELAKRGMKLKISLEELGYQVIEVFPTATAKILGFYRKNKIEMLSSFEDFNINNVRNKHEVDAIIAAYTALLYEKGRCTKMNGVVFPQEENL